MTLDVAALLDRARELRAGLRAESPSPVDVAYCATTCPRCGASDAHALGYEGSLRVASRGEVECDTVMALLEALVALFGPRAGHPSPPVAPCPCGADGSPPVYALRFFHAVAGAGADVMAQALWPEGGDAPEWSLARVPEDGTVEWIAPEDVAVERAFGRPLRPASLWRRLAADPSGGVAPYGEGLWLYAGPGESSPLDAALASLTESRPTRCMAAVTPSDASLPAWRGMHLALRPPGFRAGAVVDLAVLAHLVRLQARRNGLLATRAGDAALTLLVRWGELAWPVDLPRVARECVRQGLSLPAAAAGAVGSAREQLSLVALFLERVRAVDPGLRWVCEGTFAYPDLGEGERGRPFDLTVDPFRHRAGDLDLLRDVRFNVGRVEEHVDPDRVCACGAALAVTARLASWGFVEALLRARPDRAPVVLEALTRDGVREAAVVAAFECSRHMRPLTVPDQARAGLKGDALAERIAQDLPRNAFQVEVEVAADAAGRRAVVAAGAWVASVGLSPPLLAGLLRAAGAPLAGDEARVTAFGEHALVVAEAGYDPARWEALAEDLRRRGGEGRDHAVPFVLDRSMDVRAAPAGLFRLLPRADAAG